MNKCKWMESKKYLARDFPTTWGWDNKRITIPKGTPCIPADNIPGDWYWIQLLDDGTWSEDIASWSHIYGFKVGNLQVYDSPDASRFVDSNTMRYRKQ